MELTGKSGAKIVIIPAPFEDAEELKDAVMKEMADKGIDFSFNLEKGIDQDIDFGGFFALAMSVLSSKEIRKPMQKCLARCTYNGQKITNAVFEPQEARADYYDVQIACARENLSPFFESLRSSCAPLMAQMFAMTEKIPK